MLAARSPGPRLRAAALGLLLSPRGAVGAAICAAAVTIAAPAAAQADAYKLHMENGVKLYNDKNFAAAIVEFQAAHDARPGPNPLLNIALCEKELFHYRRAIAALEAAIAKHGDVMAPSDRKAAEDAIKDMRALLGKVVIKVEPPTAALSLDGEDLAAGAADRPIELGPGAHKITARAQGYAPADRSFTVASGQAQVVTLALAADGANVTIQAPDPRMTITIDQRPYGTGSWTGVLPVGPHLVVVSGASGPALEGQFIAVAGQPVTLRSGAGLAPHKSEPTRRRGLYLLATGSFLVPAVHPPYFADPHVDFGAGFGARIGYQVNNVAGFDLSFQHSSVQTYQTGDESGKISFRLLSERIAAGLRLSTPGKMWRFVGMVGGGVVWDQVQWGEQVMRACTGVKSGETCPLQGDVHGLDAFVLAEAVVELDVDRVLIDLGVEAQFQSTGNISGGQDVTSFKGSIYGTRPIINVGPALRVGYRFW